MSDNTDFIKFRDFQPTQFDARGLGATEDDGDWLVVPFIYQPKIAGHLEESNWRALSDAISRASNRQDKVRRRVERLLAKADNATVRAFASVACRVDETADTASADIDRAVTRLYALIGLEPARETITQLRDRIDGVRDDGDYATHRFGHWTTDFEIILVRPGSAAHREAERLIATLADYPVLDEEDFSRREYEAQCSAIEDALRPLTIEDDGTEVDSEQLAAACFSDIWEHDQSAIECSDEGCYIGEETISASLERLGYVYCDDEMTWRPEGDTCDQA